MVKTRKRIECLVFGAPSPFQQNILPSYWDVMKTYLWIRQTLINASPNRPEPTVASVSSILISELKILWSKASIPVVSDQEILHLIKNYHEKVRKIKKPIKSRNTDSMEQRMQKFRQDAKTKLFDISSCKCLDFISCKCTHKIPVKERVFLLDQRNERKMVIGSIDIVTTKRIKRAEYRQELETKTTSSTSNLKTDKSENAECNSSEEENDSEGDCYYENKLAVEKSATENSTQMRLNLPNLAHSGISDRSAAIIADKDTCKIIDRSKVRR